MKLALSWSLAASDLAASSCEPVAGLCGLARSSAVSAISWDAVFRAASKPSNLWQARTPWIPISRSAADMQGARMQSSNTARLQEKPFLQMTNDAREAAPAEDGGCRADDTPSHALTPCNAAPCSFTQAAPDTIVALLADSLPDACQ